MTTDKLHWIGGHGSPRKAFEGLVDGAMVHAISDGTWGLSVNPGVKRVNIPA